ncbi:hypothetical protein FOWG_18290, partial [Fusarium oxysporum f. sp. lycopersici MN25]
DENTRGLLEVAYFFTFSCCLILSLLNLLSLCGDESAAPIRFSSLDRLSLQGIGQPERIKRKSQAYIREAKNQLLTLPRTISTAAIQQLCRYHTSSIVLLPL